VDKQTDRQTPHDDIGRAYAQNRAAKIDACETSHYKEISIYNITLMKHR